MLVLLASIQPRLLRPLGVPVVATGALTKASIAWKEGGAAVGWTVLRGYVLTMALGAAFALGRAAPCRASACKSFDRGQGQVARQCLESFGR